MKYLASSLVAVAGLAIFAYLLVHGYNFGAVVCLIAVIAMALGIMEP